MATTELRALEFNLTDRKARDARPTRIALRGHGRSTRAAGGATARIARASV